MSYNNIYTYGNKTPVQLLNDSQQLWHYASGTSNTQPPTVEIENTFDNFYEFILTNGKKKY